MNSKVLKRVLSCFMALLLALSPVFSSGVTYVKAEGETDENVILPRPVYQFTFGDDKVNGSTVENGGLATGTKTAKLEQGAVTAAGRDSKVLSLSGGSATTAGFLTLPDDMYDTVTDGFTVSFWVQADADNNSYSRAFQSSSMELGSTNSGTQPYPNDWKEAEIAIVLGGEDYDSVINLNEANDRTKSKFKWPGRHIGSSTNWKHVTLSISTKEYAVFVDGEKVSIENTTADIAAVLPKFFEELEDYQYSALGRSLYTSDAGAKANFDDFRFYNMALKEEQIEAIYEDNDVYLPEQVYNFDFEDVNGTTVKNNAGASGTQDAAIVGSSQAIAVVYDEERESQVLKLQGGNESSSGSGYLTLPTDLYETVTDGFTVSFWVKANSGQTYSRIFQSAPGALGRTDSGVSNDYRDPEIAIVMGGETGNQNYQYDSVFNTADFTKYRIGWNGKNVGNSAEWKYITVSTSKTDYSVHINGVKLDLDLYSDMAAGLPKLFNEISNYKNNALGRSLYGDTIPNALFDDFRFYDIALTDEQAEAIYFNEYDQVIEEPGKYDEEPTLNFDLTDSLGEMKHRSTGFLYGMAEINVPSTDLVSAIRPGITVQKAADGKQHPSGDAYRLTSYLQNSGLENLQVYLQDYYLEWPYEWNGIEDYRRIVEEVVTKMTDGKTEEEKAFYSYVLFNEPDQIWYGNSGNNLQNFLNAWKTIYDTVKSIDPNAKVAGPNFAGYHQNAYNSFFAFCKQNNCLPEMITWHDLQKDKLTAFEGEYNHLQGLIATYYDESEIEPILFVNEIANFEDVGAPGPLVNWLSIYEEKDVYAALPFWGLANSLNELAADANKPNGGWWVYKWYNDMTGNKVKMTKANQGSKAKGNIIYGLTSVDEESTTVYTLFGGHENTQVANLKNLHKIEGFKDADSAHVRLYSTKFTGHHGFADETPLIYEGNLPINSKGTLQIAVENCALLDAYYAVVTPAADDTVLAIEDYNKNWTATYEAEDATLLGNAQAAAREGGSDLARSNRAEVGNIKNEEDGVEFAVSVPEDGKYKLEVYYSSAAPYVNAVTLEEDAGGQNRAIGKVVKHRVVVDGQEETAQILTYKSTVKVGYYNYETVYVDLTAGDHTIAVNHYGADQREVAVNIQKCASLDKIDLSYESVMGGDVNTPEVNIQLEEVRRDSGYTMKQNRAGYTGGGYAAGSGDLTFTVVVPEDGLYDTTIRYQTDEAGKLTVFKKSVEYAADAQATTPIDFYQLNVSEITTETGNWKDAAGNKIFLTAGANTITIQSDKTVNLDEITFAKDVEVSNDQLIVDAQAGELSGEAKLEYNEYATGNWIVTDIGGGTTDNKMQISFAVPEAGNYKLSMFYSNNEPAPVMKRKNGANYVHPYNTDLVERYAQITVNNGTPQTVYFRNTLSWEVFNNVVMDVTLEAGENTITFSNDNSYKFSEVVDDYAPTFDKFEIIPAAVAADTIVTIDNDYLYKKIMSMKSYHEADYTPASYAVFTQAMAEAETLYESGTAGQNAILAAVGKLEAAADGLVRIAEIRLAELVSTIAGAKTYLLKEEDYTYTSYAALLEEVKEAEDIVNRGDDASDEEISSAVLKLKASVRALVMMDLEIDNSTGMITCTGSNQASTHPERAWDGNTSTSPDLVTSSGGWDSSASSTTLELPEAVVFSKLSFAPRSGYTERLNGGSFQFSADGTSWVTVHTIVTGANGYTTINITDKNAYRFVRYNSPRDCYLNISDIKLYASILSNEDWAKIDADRSQFEELTSGLSGKNVTEDFEVPAELDNSTVVWSSDNEAVTIDEAGNARVNSTGGDATVTLTASVITGEAHKIYTFTVYVTGVSVQSISLNKTATVLKVGADETLTVSFIPANAADQTVIWSSSDTSVAEVADGKVTAKKAGTAMITVTSVGNPEAKASCTVTVIEDGTDTPVTAVTLNKTAVTLKVGASETLTATVSPSNATNKQVIWNTSDAGVAEISSGKITARKAGKATITVVSAANSPMKATCTVTVEADTDPVVPPLKVSSITAKSASYNSIQLNWKKVNNADGYEVYRATSKNGTYKRMKLIQKGSTVKYKSTKLKFNKKYYYKVRAYKKAVGTTVYAPYSKVVSAKTKVAAPKVTLKKASSTSARVSWKKTAGAKGYQIKYSLKKKSAFKTVNINKAGKRKYTIAGLKSGKKYYVKVRAYRKVKSKKVYGSWSKVKAINLK